jgi:hypothetical protein
MSITDSSLIVRAATSAARSTARGGLRANLQAHQNH